MYPELITRPDIKVFLPPIGGMTVYICTPSPLRSLSLLLNDVCYSAVGPASYLSDESKELTLRVHDECRSYSPDEVPTSLTLPSQATVRMSLALTSAHANRTSYSRLRSASVRRNEAALALLYTFVRKAVRSAR